MGHMLLLLHSNILELFLCNSNLIASLREQLKGEDLYLCYKGGSSLELVFS